MNEMISKRMPLITSGLASRLILWLVAALVASGAQAQTTVEYIHTDALGSPVAVTDASGNVIERSEYAPYGELLNRPQTDGPGYTGHVQDASTGLTYMQQRYYDPKIGRFLSVDPVTADPTTGSNFNRYWYANNNPFTFFDPDGRCAGSHIVNIDGTCVSTGEHTATPTAASGGLTNSINGSQSGSSSPFSGLKSYFSERNWFTGTGSLTDFEALGDDLRPALEMPQLGGGSFKLASSILLFRLGRFGVGAQGALKVGEYTFAGGAAKHLASRPYYNSPLLIKEIIAGGKAIPDSAPGAIKYIAPGTFGNAKGNWELVIHEKTLTIYHFVFVGGK